MLAVHALWRVGIAKIPARSVARQPAAIVPAAYILRDVAAECADIADLWACDDRRGFRKQRVALFEQTVFGDFGQRGKCTDFYSVGGLPHPAQRFDCAEVNERIGALRAVFEPAVSVLSATH